MRKYLTFFKNSVQVGMTYRFNFYSWFLVEGINILVACYIWLSVYKQGNTVGNYSLRALISYFVLSRIVSMTVNDHGTSDNVNTDVSQGRLTNYLLKPINYSFSLYMKNAGDIFVAMIFVIPFGLAFVYYLGNTIEFSLYTCVYFLISLVLASSISFFIWLIVGCLTFFMENTFGAQFMLWLIYSVFSGRTAPLDLMPNVVKNIANLLPFKYTLFIPLQIINGTMSKDLILSSLFYGLIWTFTLWLISHYIYKIGIKKYEGEGA